MKDQPKPEWERHTKTYWKRQNGVWKEITEVFYKRRKK